MFNENKLIQQSDTLSIWTFNKETKKFDREQVQRKKWEPTFPSRIKDPVYPPLKSVLQLFPREVLKMINFHCGGLLCYDSILPGTTLIPHSSMTLPAFPGVNRLDGVDGDRWYKEGKRWVNVPVPFHTLWELVHPSVAYPWKCDLLDYALNVLPWKQWFGHMQCCHSEIWVVLRRWTTWYSKGRT